MSTLLNKAKQQKKTLQKAGDADHDPADLNTNAVSSSGRLVNIPVEDITPNPRNDRDEDLNTDPETDELAFSMAVLGQQQPAVVVSRETFLQRSLDLTDEVPTAWVVMIGNRRHAAARKLKWATLECITRERVTPKLEQLADLGFHENVHRKGLNPLRVAYYLADQLQRLGTEQAVAAAVGKTQPWVNQLLKLLKLTPELQALVQSGELNASVGRDLAKLSQPKQRAVLDTVASLSDTARERFWRTRGWLDTPGSAPGPAAGEVAQPPAHEPDNAAKPVAAKTDPTPPATSPAKPETIRV